MVPYKEFLIPLHRKWYKRKFLGTNEVQTISIFEILKCGGGGASEMVPTKLKLEYLCTGSGTKENFSVLTSTNEVQTIGIFEILMCVGGGASEMVPQKEL